MGCRRFSIAGVANPGVASVILGIRSDNQAIGTEPTADVFMSCGFAPGQIMAMENASTSAANLEWVAHSLLAHDGRATAGPFALDDALAGTAPLRANGPMYHPYLYGSGSDPAVLGGFFGLAASHDTGDLLRALFDGVAFAHLSHLNRLRAAGVSFDGITVSGDGARSPVWPQMLSDMLGVPLGTAAQIEAGALGAAMAAAVGAGQFTGLKAAATAMVAPARMVAPDLGRTDIYRSRFKLWQAADSNLSPHWVSLRGIGDAG